MRELPSQDKLRELLDYDPETGVLCWRENGRVATRRRKDGYLWLAIDTRPILAHRAIWMLTFGCWPRWIDHENMVHDDNRLKNLRNASPSQNLANIRVRKSNKLGIKGVVANGKGGFLAYIHVLGKTRYLGTFRSPEDAKRTYDRAAQAQWGEFARAA